MPIHEMPMETRTRIDFDELMRVLMVVGFAALATWVLTAAVGVMAGIAHISQPATLRFLLAVLIVVFSRRTYWELREWYWSKRNPDERSGFASPLWENGRSNEHLEDQAGGGSGFATATGSSQPRA
jgi:fatty acid desaturase